MHFVSATWRKCSKVLPVLKISAGVSLSLCSLPYLYAMQSPQGSAGATPPQSVRIHQADVAFHAGYAAVARNDLASALRDFEQVVRLMPQLEEGHSALGAVLLQAGRYPAAIAELRRSVALKPEDRSARTNLAMAYAATGEYRKAIPLFQRLDQANGAKRGDSLPQDVTLAYARCLAGTGRTTEAMALLQRHENQGQNSSEIHDELGSLYAQQKRWAEAKEEFRQAITVDQNNGNAHLHLGVAMLADGQAQDATPELETAAKLLPQSPQPELELGDAWIAMGEDEKAIAPLQKALALDPSSPETKYRLAVALQGADHEKEAIPLFREVLAARPSDVSTMIDLALALVQTGNAKEAVGLYRNAMRLNPKDTTIYQDLGSAYLQESDLDDAIASFESGLQVSPQDAQLHYDLGLAYKLKDNVSAAVKELELASNLDPDLPEPHYTLGILYMQEGRFDDSEKQLQTALQMRPRNADGWSILGSVYRQQNKLPQAVAALTESIQQQPDQPSGYITLASILAQQGKRAEAATYRKKAADLMRQGANHQRATFATNTAKSLMEKGDISQAIEQYQDAIRDDPKYAEAYLGLAAALDKQGKSADAAAARRSADALQSPSH